LRWINLEISEEKVAQANKGLIENSPQYPENIARLKREYMEGHDPHSSLLDVTCITWQLDSQYSYD
jgi:hypothetical protein